MKQLVLASGSTARKEILERTGIPFIVDVSNYEENMAINLEPAELAKYLSKGKALDVASRHKNAVVLAADSFAVFNGELLGKPRTTEKAREMLTTLSGQCHSFITGFTIIDPDTGKEHSDTDETKVYFRKLTTEDIDGYLAKENALNNAGAYIIQNLGAVLVERIDGDYSNVMGLPLPKVAKALKEFGVDFLK
ncbi:MAG: Maf protein [Parcubacteria group bacterium GW2011_GWB1_42_6]|nr:MAG: Maf protein [Parcubacteria group bacterium GW2011_GWB1_42_6]